MQVQTASSTELGIVLRHMASVQSRVSELVRQQQAQIAQLQAELMRMRAQRMLEFSRKGQECDVQGPEEVQRCV